MEKGKTDDHSATLVLSAHENVLLGNQLPREVFECVMFPVETFMFLIPLPALVVELSLPVNGKFFCQMKDTNTDTVLWVCPEIMVECL